MDNQERVKILDRAFSIMEEIIKNFFIDDEELFRERVKNAIQNAILENDDQLEYKALLDAQAKFDDLSFAEITEMYQLLSDEDEDHDDDDWDGDKDDDWDGNDEDDVTFYDDDDWYWDKHYDEPIEFSMKDELPKVFMNDAGMRKKILNTELGGSVPLFDQEHKYYGFTLVMRLAFLDKYYCYMIRFDNFDDVKEGVFYEYIVGKHAIEDKMVLVEDKDLILKLGVLL